MGEGGGAGARDEPHVRVVGARAQARRRARRDGKGRGEAARSGAVGGGQRYWSLQPLRQYVKLARTSAFRTEELVQS